MQKKTTSVRNKMLWILQVTSIFLTILAGISFNFTRGFEETSSIIPHRTSAIVNSDVFVTSVCIIFSPVFFISLRKRNGEFTFAEFFLNISSIIFQLILLFANVQINLIVTTLRKLNLPLIFFFVSTTVHLVTIISRLIITIRNSNKSRISLCRCDRQIRIAHSFFLFLIIFSTWLFSFTKGLMTDSETYCIEWTSSVADDNIVILFGYLFSTSFGISVLNHKKSVGIAEAVINIAILVFQFSMIILGLDGGCILQTLRYSWNIPLFLWCYSIIENILTVAILISIKHLYKSKQYS